MSTRKTPRSGPALDPLKKTVAPPKESPQVPPQNIDGDEDKVAPVPKNTPYNTLRQLANLPRPTTPLHRASSTGPPSGRSTRRTPVAQVRTPGVPQRLGGSAKKPNAAVTPHGRAAMREMEARRAGLTPGKDRRRSGRQQRETPRETLRALSRLLAPKTKPTIPTPENPKAVTGRFGKDDFLDDGPVPERPRLSLPIGEDDDDDDDSLLLPPRSAGLENENFTVQSIELPRRAVSELPPGRLSRGSFGSVRMSDQFGDLNDQGVGGVFDSSFAMGGAFDDDDVVLADDDDLPRYLIILNRT
jgi:hypothetical protein